MRFLTVSVCVLFASALAGAKAQLKNMLKTLGFYDIICVCAVCARKANMLETERKSNIKLFKCKQKTPCHGSSETSPKKHRFGSQNGSKNRPRRPPGAPWAPPARDLRAKSFPKALLETSRGALENKRKFKTKFGPNWQKRGLSSGSSGGRGAARKSLSWRIRPGRTRLNDSTRSLPPAVVGGFLGCRLCRRPLGSKIMTTYPPWSLP